MQKEILELLDSNAKKLDQLEKMVIDLAKEKGLPCPIIKTPSKET